MNMYLHKRSRNIIYRIVSVLVMVAFIFTGVLGPTSGYAQGVAGLPVPGTMIAPTPGFAPALMKGIRVYPDNPLQFDFIVDSGHSKLTGPALDSEAMKMIKYFLATLTVPDADLWVNLSPYEQGRVVPEKLGETDMGRDLLAQDYILKQLTASLIYPENELGKKFWDRVYKRAQELYGKTDIPVNTFNKVWVVPQKAVVYEEGDSAFVAHSHLQVMLEQDYVAQQHNRSLQNNLGRKEFGTDKMNAGDVTALSEVSAKVIREVIIPEIEKEVNEGQNFASLRQIYNSMILATWFKQALKQSLLGQVYVNQNKTKGIDLDDKQIKDKIYNQYLEAFKKGVYSYIKEEQDPISLQMVPRKYFSGGFDGPKLSQTIERRRDRAMLAPMELRGLRPAGNTGSYTVALVENAGKEMAAQMTPKRPAAAADPAMLAQQRHTWEDVTQFSGASPVDLSGYAINVKREDASAQLLQVEFYRPESESPYTTKEMTPPAAAKLLQILGAEAVLFPERFIERFADAESETAEALVDQNLLDKYSLILAAQKMRTVIKVGQGNAKDIKLLVVLAEEKSGKHISPMVNALIQEILKAFPNLTYAQAYRLNPIGAKQRGSHVKGVRYKLLSTGSNKVPGLEKLKGEISGWLDGYVTQQMSDPAMLAHQTLAYRQKGNGMIFLHHYDPNGRIKRGDLVMQAFNPSQQLHATKNSPKGAGITRTESYDINGRLTGYAVAEGNRIIEKKREVLQAAAQLEILSGQEVQVLAWLLAQLKSQKQAPTDEIELRDGRYTTVFTESDAQAWHVGVDAALSLLEKQGAKIEEKIQSGQPGRWLLSLPDQKELENNFVALKETADAAMLAEKDSRFVDTQIAKLTANYEGDQIVWEDVEANDANKKKVFESIEATRPVLMELMEKIANEPALQAQVQKIQEAITVLFDKQGRSLRKNLQFYPIHPLQVTLNFIKRFGITDPEFILSALLHDAMEEIPEFGATPGLIGEQFGRQVQSDVQSLTNKELSAAQREWLTGYIKAAMPSIDDAALEAVRTILEYQVGVAGEIAGHSRTLLLKSADFSDNALRQRGLASKPQLQSRLSSKYRDLIAIFAEEFLNLAQQEEAKGALANVALVAGLRAAAGEYTAAFTEVSGYAQGWQYASQLTAVVEKIKADYGGLRGLKDELSSAVDPAMLSKSEQPIDRNRVLVSTYNPATGKTTHEIRSRWDDKVLDKSYTEYGNTKGDTARNILDRKKDSDRAMLAESFPMSDPAQNFPEFIAAVEQQRGAIVTAYSSGVASVQIGQGSYGLSIRESSNSGYSNGDESIALKGSEIHTRKTHSWGSYDGGGGGGASHQGVFSLQGIIHNEKVLVPEGRLTKFPIAAVKLQRGQITLVLTKEAYDALPSTSSGVAGFSVESADRAMLATATGTFDDDDIRGRIIQRLVQQGLAEPQAMAIVTAAHIATAADLLTQHNDFDVAYDAKKGTLDIVPLEGQGKWSSPATQKPVALTRLLDPAFRDGFLAGITAGINTFMMIHPDGMDFKEDILRELRRAGFEVLEGQKMVLTEAQARLFYKEQEAHPAYQSAVKDLIAGKVMPLFLTRRDGDAIERATAVQAKIRSQHVRPSGADDLYTDAKEGRIAVLSTPDSPLMARIRTRRVFQFIDQAGDAPAKKPDLAMLSGSLELWEKVQLGPEDEVIFEIGSFGKAVTVHSLEGHNGGRFARVWSGGGNFGSLLGEAYGDHEIKTDDLRIWVEDDAVFVESISRAAVSYESVDRAMLTAKEDLRLMYQDNAGATHRYEFLPLHDIRRNERVVTVYKPGTYQQVESFQVADLEEPKGTGATKLQVRNANGELIREELHVGNIIPKVRGEVLAAGLAVEPQTADPAMLALPKIVQAKKSKLRRLIRESAGLPRKAAYQEELAEWAGDPQDMTQREIDNINALLNSPGSLEKKELEQLRSARGEWVDALREIRLRKRYRLDPAMLGGADQIARESQGATVRINRREPVVYLGDSWQITSTYNPNRDVTFQAAVQTVPDKSTVAAVSGKEELWYSWQLSETGDHLKDSVADIVARLQANAQREGAKHTGPRTIVTLQTPEYKEKERAARETARSSGDKAMLAMGAEVQQAFADALREHLKKQDAEFRQEKKGQPSIYTTISVAAEADKPSTIRFAVGVRTKALLTPQREVLIKEALLEVVHKAVQKQFPQYVSSGDLVKVPEANGFMLTVEPMANRVSPTKLIKAWKAKSPKVGGKIEKVKVGDNSLHFSWYSSYYQQEMEYDEGQNGESVQVLAKKGNVLVVRYKKINVYNEEVKSYYYDVVIAPAYVSVKYGPIWKDGTRGKGSPEKTGVEGGFMGYDISDNGRITIYLSRAGMKALSSSGTDKQFLNVKFQQSPADSAMLAETFAYRSDHTGWSYRLSFDPAMRIKKGEPRMTVYDVNDDKKAPYSLPAEEDYGADGITKLEVYAPQGGLQRIEFSSGNLIPETRAETISNPMQYWVLDPVTMNKVSDQAMLALSDETMEGVLGFIQLAGVDENALDITDVQEEVRESTTVPELIGRLARRIGKPAGEVKAMLKTLQFQTPDGEVIYHGEADLAMLGKSETFSRQVQSKLKSQLEVALAVLDPRKIKTQPLFTIAIRPDGKSGNHDRPEELVVEVKLTTPLSELLPARKKAAEPRSLRAAFRREKSTRRPRSTAPDLDTKIRRALSKVTGDFILQTAPAYVLPRYGSVTKSENGSYLVKVVHHQKRWSGFVADVKSKLKTENTSRYTSVAVLNAGVRYQGWANADSGDLPGLVNYSTEITVKDQKVDIKYKYESSLQTSHKDVEEARILYDLATGMLRASSYGYHDPERGKKEWADPVEITKKMPLALKDYVIGKDGGFSLVVSPQLAKVIEQIGLGVGFIVEQGSSKEASVSEDPAMLGAPLSPEARKVLARRVNDFAGEWRKANVRLEGPAMITKSGFHPIVEERSVRLGLDDRDEGWENLSRYEFKSLDKGGLSVEFWQENTTFGGEGFAGDQLRQAVEMTLRPRSVEVLFKNTRDGRVVYEKKESLDIPDGLQDFRISQDGELSLVLRPEVMAKFFDDYTRQEVMPPEFGQMLKLESATPAPDAAMLGKQTPVVNKREPVGGINLDPALLDLQIKRDGKGIPLPLPLQPIQNMRIDGFLPIIINVVPVNLPLMLGLGDEPADPLKIGGEPSPSKADNRRSKQTAVEARVEQLSKLE